jgi:hypothetical protein
LAYLAYQLEVQDTSAKRENVKAAGGRKFYGIVLVAVVRKNCVRERIRVNATLLHCDLLIGRGREGKLANTAIDGEYNLSGPGISIEHHAAVFAPARADSTVL